MTADSYLADQVRLLDPDRYVTALFAPDRVRHDLFALYAFNAEVARAREAVSEPVLGQIRLRWWRDAIAECYAGSPREHFVVTPLAAAIRRHGLSRSALERLVDAHEADLDGRPVETMDDLRRYARATSGSLTRLALEILGAKGTTIQEIGEQVGAAWALVGIMRSLPVRFRLGQPAIPAELARKHGLYAEGPGVTKSSPEVRSIVREICLLAGDSISSARAESRSVPQAAAPALLQARLAELYLKRLARTGYDPFDPRNAGRLRFPLWQLIPYALRGRF